MRLYASLALRLGVFSAALLACRLGAESKDSTCVRQSEFVLGRVRLAAVSTQVYDSLGEPLRRHRSWSEDDGGRYDLLQLTYPNLSVDIGRGDRVERVATTSPALALPSGVRVGMTSDEVTRRLGLSPIAAQVRDEKLYVDACLSDPNGDYGLETALHLFFRAGPTGERRLIRIELSNYGP